MATAPQSTAETTPYGVAIDVDVLLAELDRVLPPRKSGLTTPFVEAVLLIERLRVAGVSMQMERRTLTREGQYIIALAVRVNDTLFNARSKTPWDDFQQWQNARHDKPARWLADDPLTSEEVADAMQSTESAYAGYRGGVDLAIQKARACGEARILDEGTRQRTGQATVVRL